MALREGNGAAAIFRIGNQRILDVWYGRLPESDDGIRAFGVHRYTDAPKALPPHLTLYVGHPVIELDALIIPESIEVVTKITDEYRKKHEGDAIIKAIDTFVAEHEEKRKAQVPTSSEE